MDRLKRAVQNANPLNGILSVAKTYIPQFIPKFTGLLEQINKPESEGGLLKEGQERIVLMVVLENGQPILSKVPLSRNEQGQLVLERPLSNSTIDDFMNLIQDGNE